MRKQSECHADRRRWGVQRGALKRNDGDSVERPRHTLSAGVERDHSHEACTGPIICYRTAIAPPSAPTHTDMGIRDTFSRLKDKLDPGSKGKRRKQDGAGSGTDGEGVGSAGSLPRPGPSVAAGGHSGGGERSNVDVHQVRLTSELPRSDELESRPGDKEGGGGDGSRRHSHLRPDVEATVGSGPGGGGSGTDDHGEGEQSYPRSSTPSTSHSGEPGGA